MTYKQAHGIGIPRLSLDNVTTGVELPGVGSAMAVDALPGMATPPYTAEDLVRLGIVGGFLEKVPSVGARLVVMTGNGFLDPTHVVGRDVEPPEHPFLARIHQHAPVVVSGEEIDQRGCLVGEAALELGVRIRLAILEVHGASL